ncbi:MAG: hypothetical protein KUG57_11835 [Ilumatobacteraceae bacterium]|nr:hypothetical protein [Ilumatobacteraceae bacterium]
MLDQINKLANNASTTINDVIADNVSADRGRLVTEKMARRSDRMLDGVVDVNRRLVGHAVTSADRAAEQFPVELPFRDRLPTPAQAGERYISLLERAVSVRRHLNERVINRCGTDAPETAVSEGAVNETAAKKTTVKTATTAKKMTAKKVTAKKSTAKRATASKSTKTASTKTASAKKAAGSS